jgi:DNA-binding GntR family transcriptional regulator
LATEGEGDAVDITDAICETIKASILDRSLRPGARLTEDVIGEHFGVSRTVVRSAMNRLQQDRLVELRKNRGAFVAEPTIGEALNVLRTRLVIETAIVEQVIDRITAADLHLLQAHVRKENEAHSQVSQETVIVLAGQFHMLLARIAGNDVMENFLDQLIQRSSLVISYYGRTVSNSCGAHDHTLLVEAIAARDRKRSLQILTAHLKEIEAGLMLDTDSYAAKSLADVLASHSATK